jgi:hypothetical protein
MHFIEVFKTNVATEADSARMLHLLTTRLPDCRMTFDLEDCDRIFKVVCVLRPVDCQQIIYIFKQEQFHCEILHHEYINQS